MHMELLCTLEQRYIYSQSDQLNRTKEGERGFVCWCLHFEFRLCLELNQFKCVILSQHSWVLFFSKLTPHNLPFVFHVIKVEGNK